MGAAVRGGIALQPTAIALYLNIRVDLLIVGALTSARATRPLSLAASLAGVVLVGAAQLALAGMRRQTDAPLLQANRYTVEFIRQTSIVVVVGSLLAAAAMWPLLRLGFGRTWTPSALPAAILCLAAIPLATERARSADARADESRGRRQPRGDNRLSGQRGAQPRPGPDHRYRRRRLGVAGVVHSISGVLMLGSFARSAEVDLRSALLVLPGRDDLAVRLLLALPGRLARRFTALL